MKRVMKIGLVLGLLLMAAVAVQAQVVANRYLGDKAIKVDATVTATAAATALPTGRQGVCFFLTNDGEHTVYVTINVTATITVGFPLKPNESTPVIPAAVRSVGYICAAEETSLLRGWILYY